MKKLIKSAIALTMILSILVSAYPETFTKIDSDLHKQNLQLKPYYFNETGTLKKPESGLKRFEVIFLTTLPLTMFLSFTLVQLYEMKEQKTISPTLSKDNLKFVFTLSLTSSTFIAIKDHIKWKKSKKKDEGNKK